MVLGHIAPYTSYLHVNVPRLTLPLSVAVLSHIPDLHLYLGICSMPTLLYPSVISTRAVFLQRGIQGERILQSFMSSSSASSVLKTRPCWADDQMDLWCNLCKLFAPCEPENQRQDFRMASGQRLSSLCYLIANFHRLFPFTCSFPLAFLLAKHSCTGIN